MPQHYLHPLFNPRSVAVFGASEREESVAGTLFRNLHQAGFQGTVYPVNPKHETVFGERCYASAAELPAIPELALIATPAATVVRILEECGQRGIRHAIVLSAGFREVGAKGAALEDALSAVAHQYGIRFIGPNCLGIQRPAIGLNATFSQGATLAGDLALVSQSGALCTAMLDWAETNGIGFSSVISTGASADLDFGEILDYLAYDTRTKGILLYIEGIRDARRFMSALRATARFKPVVMVKVGRHAAGSRAVASHTGALVGSDAVFDALVRRAGVVRVNTILQLFASARALATHIQPSGNRLAIVTNGGGPGVMATDLAVDLGVRMAELSPDTIAALDAVLPDNWSRANPLDIIGDATAARYRATVEACLQDGNVDGVLVMLTPQAMTRPTEVAAAVVEVAQGAAKPVLTCWMGDGQVREGRALFKQAGIPYFTTPEPAVEVFSFLSAFYENQRQLMQTPGPLSQQAEPDVEGARLIIEGALAHGRHLLNEVESKALLSAFRIPVAQTLIARDPTEAMLLAQQMGFPVAMKINSPDITHKSDVNGVRLGLSSGQAVRAAFGEMLAEVRRLRPEATLDGVVIEPMVARPHAREVLLGVTSDPVLGPVIVFGAGGVDVEAFQDRAVTLPPLNRYLARDLIRRTRIATLLGPFRNRPPADMDALENVLLRLSEMVCELPWLAELDINPLLVDERGALALDARIVIAPRVPTAERYGHMAIHPYPAHLVSRWQLPGGENVVIRPIRPEDAELTQAFVRGLSAETKYFRFMDAVRELTPVMLARLTQIDYSREMALLALAELDGREVELGVARYSINPDGRSCEFALVVGDAWQKQGIGHKLMDVLMDVARSKGLEAMEGEVLRSNRPMLKLVEALGFRVEPHPEDDSVRRIVRAL
ncbi:bifunctional acetate--CoA ligase family protein/GNAT family N-acetyltransferase [Thiobacillus sedimenti]|uniref:Bifunctional acetate--CoA ligase family protein/GNAT family N-acetyltransferase n=1 Tax=Thiobacillus sedimenti TaxID=3110231 RepID=A0ABZ1CGR1_9PROT|nr:bifunctional acetate--CoA ligase family protein/GNAT family N-acetyltransferase [Thiobacillus sp. SCUT-2]WRS38549.1 bifunctional acetate--CoA ligase family protein/GNAT family N-acetyltransferase [Thiobacillus sp. SCUT-2]